MKLKLLVLLIVFCVNNYDCKLKFGRGWFGGGSSVNKPVVRSSSGGGTIAKPVVTSNNDGWFGGGTSVNKPVVTSSSGGGIKAKPFFTSNGGDLFGGGSTINKPIGGPTIMKSESIPPTIRRTGKIPINKPIGNDKIGWWDVESLNPYYGMPDLTAAGERRDGTEYSPKELDAVSNLPFIVPIGTPIMHCNGDQIDVHININESTYACVNESITVSCYQFDATTNKTINTCPGRILNCDSKENSPIYCATKYLVGKVPMYCNSVAQLNGTDSIDNKTSVVICYSGSIDEVINVSKADSRESTQNTSTKPKSLSFLTGILMFLLWVIGKLHILDN